MLGFSRDKWQKLNRSLINTKICDKSRAKWTKDVNVKLGEMKAQARAHGRRTHGKSLQSLQLAVQCLRAMIVDLAKSAILVRKRHAEKSDKEQG